MNTDQSRIPSTRRNGRAETKVPDRLPPHSLEAEAALLGCCLLDGFTVNVCLEKLRGPEVFYDLRHRELFQVLCGMYERQAAIDLVSVRQELNDRGKLEAVGGDAYLVGLPDKAPSAANAAQYADIVREKYLLRRMIQVCGGVINDIYEYAGDVDEIFDRVERDILAVNEARVQAHEIHIRDALKPILENIEDYARGKPQLGGLSTGLDYVDKMTLGLWPSEMIVVAARPGMGKTSLGLQIVEHIACELKQPCGVFTLEMSAEQLAARGLFARAPADFQRYRTGFLKTHEDMPKIIEANLALSKAPIYLDETPGINVLQLRARARRWQRQYGIKFLMVDYIQLMRPSRNYNNREQEVAEASGGIKALAKELKIPILVLAQLNREVEKNRNRRPQLADLRESGAIEQDADVVGLLYEPRLDEKEFDELEKSAGADWSDRWRPMNLNIAKQRNGPLGDCKLMYRKKSMRFENG